MRPIALFFTVFFICCSVCSAASHRTANFVTTAPNAATARIVCDAAEAYRKQHALQWLGYEIPQWTHPCQITVSKMSADTGNGGATSFAFVENRPLYMTMTIQGSPDTLVNAALAHEVLHTVFASHFGGPVPRWADEGACTSVEPPDVLADYDRMLVQFLTSNRGIPFNRMFALQEYPSDVLPLYAQGCSVVRFLLQHPNGKRRFVNYLKKGIETENWTAATKECYGYNSLSDLQTSWLDWVRNKTPDVTITQKTSYRWLVGRGWCQQGGVYAPGPLIGIGPIIRNPTNAQPYQPQYGGTPKPYVPPVVEVPETPVVSPQPQPTQQPLTPVPVVIDYDRIGAAVIAQLDMDSLRGPVGPAGPAGRDGSNGVNGVSPDPQALASITTNAVLNYIQQHPDQFRGPPGADGRNGVDGARGRDGVDGSDGSIPNVDYGEIVKRVLDQMPPLRVQIMDGQRNVVSEHSYVFGDPIELPPIVVENYDASGNLVESQAYPFPGPIRLRGGTAPRPQ